MQEKQHLLKLESLEARRVKSDYIYDLYSTLQSAKYNTKEKKEKGTDRQIYTVVAHINVSHEQIG